MKAQFQYYPISFFYPLYIFLAIFTSRLEVMTQLLCFTRPPLTPLDKTSRIYTDRIIRQYFQFLLRGNALIKRYGKSLEY